jgi:anti-anti-sigma regulatory factor
MVDPDKPHDYIDVAVYDTDAFIRVRGRGCFKNSPAVKLFCHEAQGRGCERFVFEMADCLGMDSTFMGMLAGLAVSLRSGAGNPIIMINLSDHNADLLKTLGLDLLLDSLGEEGTLAGLQDRMSDVIDFSLIDCPDPQSRITIETMLAAHQQLVDVDQDNFPKFKDVIKYLEKSVSDLAEGDQEARS